MTFVWIYIGTLVVMVVGLVIWYILLGNKKKSDPKDDSNDHFNKHPFDPH